MEPLEVSPDGSTADLHEANLPPVDRGRGAWGFLAACFMIEALIWGKQMHKFFLLSLQKQLLTICPIGFTFSYGIFQDYYSTHEPFKSSGDIAVVGTCAMVSSLSSWKFTHESETH